MASRGAKINSIDTLARFKANYAKFGELAQLAVSNAESDVRRTVYWLQHEQKRYWENQIKHREKRFAEARTDLARAELQSRDTRPSNIIERKNLEKAKRALEEAHYKLQRVRYWSQVIEKEFMLYKGQMQSLAGQIEREVPHGLARLTNLQRHLEAYVKTHAPRSAAPRPATSAEPKEKSTEEGA